MDASIGSWCKQRFAAVIFTLDRNNWKRKDGNSKCSFSILGAKLLQTVLFETMDKSVFYNFKPEEEVNQGIAYMLLEMFKLRRYINMLNLKPKIADEFFNQN